MLHHALFNFGNVQTFFTLCCNYLNVDSVNPLIVHAAMEELHIRADEIQATFISNANRF